MIHSLQLLFRQKNGVTCLVLRSIGPYYFLLPSWDNVFTEDVRGTLHNTALVETDEWSEARFPLVYKITFLATQHIPTHTSLVKMRGKKQVETMENSLAIEVRVGCHRQKRVEQSDDYLTKTIMQCNLDAQFVSK